MASCTLEFQDPWYGSKNLEPWSFSPITTNAVHLRNNKTAIESVFPTCPSIKTHKPTPAASNPLQKSKKEASVKYEYNSLKIVAMLLEFQTISNWLKYS